MMNDIKPGWLNIARHLQASTTTNAGYAIVGLRIVAAKTQPLFWTKATITPIHPASIADLQVNEALLSLLSALAQEQH